MNQEKKIYLFSFFSMFLIIIPVAVPFWTSLGLSMQEIFELQAFFGITIVILEVPFGYVCDLWGRKKTLLFGAFFFGGAFTYLNFARSFWDLVFFELIAAIAQSLISGADISLLYDSVGISDRKKATKSLANMQLASLSGESIASLLGGFLAVFSFAHVLIANAITAWLPFFIAWSFHEPVYKKMNKVTHADNIKKVLSYILSNKDRTLILTFLNLVIWGLSTFFAVWLFQKYWQMNHIRLAFFGGIWAIYNITAGLMGKMVHGLEHKFGPISLILFLGLAPIVGYFGMALLGSWLGVIVGLLFYLSRGITGVLLNDALNWRTPSEFRATLNSLQSLFFRFGFAIFGPLIGFTIDRYGMNIMLIILGFTFLFLFFIALLPLIRAVKKITPQYIPET